MYYNPFGCVVETNIIAKKNITELRLFFRQISLSRGTDRYSRDILKEKKKNE